MSKERKGKHFWLKPCQLLRVNFANSFCARLLTAAHFSFLCFDAKLFTRVKAAQIMLVKFTQALLLAVGREIAPSYRFNAILNCVLFCSEIINIIMTDQETLERIRREVQNEEWFPERYPPKRPTTPTPEELERLQMLKEANLAYDIENIKFVNEEKRLYTKAKKVNERIRYLDKIKSKKTRKEKKLCRKKGKLLSHKIHCVFMERMSMERKFRDATRSKVKPSPEYYQKRAEARLRAFLKEMYRGTNPPRATEG
jgi:hypothetical protein